jgi:hypothetical protein
MLVFNKYYYKNKKSKLYFGYRVAVLNNFIYQTRGRCIGQINIRLAVQWNNLIAYTNKICHFKYFILLPLSQILGHFGFTRYTFLYASRYSVPLDVQHNFESRKDKTNNNLKRKEIATAVIY